MLKRVLTRPKVRPARSNAATVLLKSGVAGFAAIASISFRFSAIEASRAGLNWSTWIRSKGGTPPYGPVQGASRGLPAAAEEGAIIARATRTRAAARRNALHLSIGRALLRKGRRAERRHSTARGPGCLERIARVLDAPWPPDEPVKTLSFRSRPFARRSAECRGASHIRRLPNDHEATISRSP